MKNVIAAIVASVFVLGAHAQTEAAWANYYANIMRKTIDDQRAAAERESREPTWDQMLDMQKKAFLTDMVNSVPNYLSISGKREYLRKLVADWVYGLIVNDAKKGISPTFMNFFEKDVREALIRRPEETLVNIMGDAAGAVVAGKVSLKDFVLLVHQSRATWLSHGLNASLGKSQLEPSVAYAESVLRQFPTAVLRPAQGKSFSNEALMDLNRTAQQVAEEVNAKSEKAGNDVTVKEAKGVFETSLAPRVRAWLHARLRERGTERGAANPRVDRTLADFSDSAAERQLVTRVVSMVSNNNSRDNLMPFTREALNAFDEALSMSCSVAKGCYY